VNVDGESSGMVHVSISIANDEIDNVDMVGMAKGIKRLETSRGKRKREKSWVEKLARKTKRYSQRKKKSSQENLEQSALVNFYLFAMY
jgi:hypothetical protein